MTTSSQMQAAVDKAVTNFDRFNQFVNGDVLTDVQTDNGVIPSLRKSLTSATIDGFPGLSSALGLKADKTQIVHINVLHYGAKGDGVTDDSAAFAAAIAAANAAGGGDVLVPATGAAYVIGTGLTLNHGVRLVGIGGRQFYGADASVATWTSKGCWLRPTDTVNPAVTLAAPGTGVVGINFIYSQPEPSATSGVAWTPTTYPYAIKVVQSYFELKDICILNTTHGINIEYLSTNGGGTYSVLSDIWLGCYGVGIRYKNVNDTIHVRGIHHRNMWRVTNSNVVTYIQANATAEIYEYCDNIMLDSVEYFQQNIGQYFKNSTVNAGAFNLTHAASYCQYDNVLFNLVRQPVAVENGTTDVSASYGQVTLSTDPTTGASGSYAIDFASDNVTVQFGQIRCAYIGKGILQVGNGIGGRVTIDNLFGTSQAYAQNLPGASAINVAAGASVYLGDGGKNLQRPFGAGFRKVGAGLLTGPGRVLLNAGSLSGVATLDMVLTDYDLYRGIEIEVSGMIPATDGVEPRLRFSTDGGATWISSGYSYSINVTTDSGVNAPTGSTNSAQIALSHPSALVGNGAVEGINLTVKIVGQQNTARWPRVQFDGAYVDNSATPQTIRVAGSGTNRAANDVDAIRLFFSGGNIASVDFAIYGIL